MTKEKAKLYSELLLAYSNGATIEVEVHNMNGPLRWQVVNIDKFVDYFKYRIKPELKLVPFTFEDNLLFRDKWFISKKAKRLGKLLTIFDKGVSFHLHNGWEDYTYLLNNYTFEDGSPCGKYVNE